MNLKQLAAFREVMLTGSVSAAARTLNRTQPAVSAAISTLEAELGLELFERRSGRLIPVPEAHYLLAEATEILTRVENSRRTLANLRNLQKGSIRAITVPGPSVFYLPELVRRFIEGRDGIDVSLIARNYFQVYQLVSVQQFDVGIADLMPDISYSPSLLAQETLRLRCVCAIRDDDPLASANVITAEDLHRRPMAALRKEHPTTIQTRAAFESKAAHFYQRFEMQFFIPMFTMIEHGMAAAIVDPISAESYRIYSPAGGRVVFRPFAPAVFHEAALITPLHRPLSRLATEFTAFMRTHLREIEASTLAAPRPRESGRSIVP